MDTRTRPPDHYSVIDLAGEPGFLLGASRVSPSTREIFRGTERELLEPRLMQVLVALFQANGRVVSRDELIARCWEGRIVGEDAINRAISRLRRLSEVDGEASFQLETIPRVGYRLATHSEREASAATSQAMPQPPVPGALPGRESAEPPSAIDPVTPSGNLLYRHRLSAAVAALTVAAALAATAWLLWPARPVDTSVAVLPFVNLSGDPKEGYFSDGMTEEITAALANVKGLSVVARTSAFAFKGKSEDIIAIGRALHASHIIEGSVRREGNEVRITTQLIRTDTGSHIWTDSYDRELKDVFGVQEDIARAVAAALQVPLGLKQGEKLVSNRDIDPESYKDYLRANAMVRLRGLGTPLTAPIALLKQVVARQPNYAPAWALLAQAYWIEPQFSPAYRKGSVEELRRLVNETRPAAEAAAHRAIQLDPRNVHAYAFLASMQPYGRWAEQERLFKEALRLDPLHPQLLQEYSAFLANSGATKQALVVREQLYALEPLLPAYNAPYSRILSESGDTARALAIAEGLPSGYESHWGLIALAYCEMGRYKEAADAILKIPRNAYPPEVIEAEARLLRMAPSPAKREDFPDLGFMDWTFAYIGLPERALEFDERILDAGYKLGSFDKVWLPSLAALRKTERFKAIVRRMGLVDYWRARGWPDHCHPIGAEDFACN